MPPHPRHDAMCQLRQVPCDWSFLRGSELPRPGGGGALGFMGDSSEVSGDVEANHSFFPAAEVALLGLLVLGASGMAGDAEDSKEFKIEACCSGRVMSTQCFSCGLTCVQ